jgi:hypothetical protein
MKCKSIFKDEDFAYEQNCFWFIRSAFSVLFYSLYFNINEKFFEENLQCLNGEKKICQ